MPLEPAGVSASAGAGGGRCGSESPWRGRFLLAAIAAGRLDRLRLMVVVTCGDYYFTGGNELPLLSSAASPSVPGSVCKFLAQIVPKVPHACLYARNPQVPKVPKVPRYTLKSSQGFLVPSSVSDSSSSFPQQRKNIIPLSLGYSYYCDH
jgi:hypothetical protein